MTAEQARQEPGDLERGIATMAAAMHELARGYQATRAAMDAASKAAFATGGLQAQEHLRAHLTVKRLHQTMAMELRALGLEPFLTDPVTPQARGRQGTRDGFVAGWRGRIAAASRSIGGGFASF